MEEEREEERRKPAEKVDPDELLRAQLTELDSRHKVNLGMLELQKNQTRYYPGHLKVLNWTVAISVLVALTGHVRTCLSDSRQDAFAARVERREQAREQKQVERERLAGETSGYVSVGFEANAVETSKKNRYWINYYLQLRNHSRRPVQVLAISTWVSTPPNQGTQPVLGPFFNDFGGAEPVRTQFSPVFPNQEVEYPGPLTVLETTEKAASLYAEVIFAQNPDGTECIFNPDQVPNQELKPEYIKRLRTERQGPEVCVGTAGSSPAKCSLPVRGCEYWRVQRLISLKSTGGTR